MFMSTLFLLVSSACFNNVSMFLESVGDSCVSFPQKVVPAGLHAYAPCKDLAVSRVNSSNLI